MKTPLSYQVSEYDCGPTTLINAINYLFDRRQISPTSLSTYICIVWTALITAGELGKSGTSKIAMKFLGCWLNQYRDMRKLPIYCESLNIDEIHIDRDSRIVNCLRRGGCAVVRVHLGCGHYVLLTVLKERLISACLTPTS